MEVQILTHPNFQNYRQRINQDDVETELLDSENKLNRDTVKNVVVQNVKPQGDLTTEIDSHDLHLKSSLVGLKSPEYTFDLDRLSVVRFSAELLNNLVLTIEANGYFGKFNESFDGTVSYIIDRKFRFRDLVLEKGGYLKEEANYFHIDKVRLSKGTKSTCLRNSRVFLYWNGIKLNDSQVKRILTLGLAFLIGSISYAELSYNIKIIVPDNTFEIKINYVKNSYVVIGIEQPVFGF